MYNCILMYAVRKQDAKLGIREVLRQTVLVVGDPSDPWKIPVWPLIFDGLPG